MSNPFPGMNPYLEGRGLWSDFHSRLINHMSEALQGQIRPKYNARIEERIHLVQPPRQMYPDVTVVKPPMTRPEVIGGVLTIDEPVIVEPLVDPPTRRHIEIVHVGSGEVVTAIELLSPFNKNGKGRTQYINKQETLLSSDVNLLEIDLLANGQHTVAVAKVDADAYTDQWRYIVCLHRPELYMRYEFWPIALKDRLPRCAVPLRDPDPDAVLDLPTIFQRVYDISGSNDFIDYHKPPPIDLNDQEKIWLNRLLQTSGHRKKTDSNGA